MGFDDELRSGSLKAYTSLYSYDCVAHIAVPADAVCRAYLLNLLYRLYLVVERFVVYGCYLSFVKGDSQQLFFCLRDMFQISLLWQSFRRVEQFAAADARAPYSYII